MASKSAPVRLRKSEEISSMSVSFPSGAMASHPSSLSPWKYQSLPLSATMKPYFLSAHDGLRRGRVARRRHAGLEPEAKPHGRVGARVGARGVGGRGDVRVLGRVEREANGVVD